MKKVLVFYGCMQHRPQKRMEERVSLTHLFFTPGCDTGRKENCLGRLRQKSKSEEKRRDKKKGLPCLSVEEKVYDKGGFTLLTRLFKKFRPKKGPIKKAGKEEPFTNRRKKFA